MIDQEIKVLKALNIDTRYVTEVIEKLMTHLKGTQKESVFSTTSIHNSIDAIDHFLLTKDAKAFAKAKFKRTRKYDHKIQFNQKSGKMKQKSSTSRPLFDEIDNFYGENEIKNLVSYSVYQTHSKVNAEWDFLIILPEFKVVINIEVKRNSDNCGNKNTNLRCASDQLDKHARYFAEKHGYMLDDQWSFMKLAAIKPNVANPKLVCKHCQNFIITEEQNIGMIWKNVTLKKQSMSRSLMKEAKKQFNVLFSRIVSFSSTTFHKKPHDLSKKISDTLITNKEKVFSGMQSKKTSISESATFEEIRSMPSNAFKTLYMNMNQIGILAKRIVVFLSDFGTGNICRFL